MARIVDLSMPIEDHFRWPVERAQAGDLAAGDIAIVKTCWDQARSPRTPAFWTEAPYLSAAACRWLLARGIKALGVDFPQDYPIRLLLEGKRAPIAEFVSHDILLRNGVILIEYLCNLAALQGPRTTLIALPLKVPGADGAPARVIAYEA